MNRKCSSQELQPQKANSIHTYARTHAQICHSYTEWPAGNVAWYSGFHHQYSVGVRSYSNIWCALLCPLRIQAKKYRLKTNICSLWLWETQNTCTSAFNLITLFWTQSARECSIETFTLKDMKECSCWVKKIICVQRQGTQKRKKNGLAFWAGQTSTSSWKFTMWH